MQTMMPAAAEQLGGAAQKLQRKTWQQDEELHTHTKGEQRNS